MAFLFLKETYCISFVIRGLLLNCLYSDGLDNSRLSFVPSSIDVSFFFFYI